MTAQSTDSSAGAVLATGMNKVYKVILVMSKAI